MEILKTDKSFKKGGVAIENIITIKMVDYTIYVFPGTLSENDILVKYRFMTGRLRTPKHIHWVTDLLMKMQGKKRLTKKFVNRLKLIWNDSRHLNDRGYESIKNIVEGSDIDLKEFESMNNYGEYSVEFLYVLMKLLAIQEKTNRSDAYMFGKVIDALLEDKLDIFSIVSKAGYNGR